MIKATITDSFTTKITSTNHLMIADEPLDLGGNDKGMNPQEILESSLASCTTITLRMYLKRKNWDVKQILVYVDTLNEKSTTDLSMHKTIEVDGALDQKQLDRLLYIAGRCPIHKILEKSLSIESEIRFI